jgi:hypothetical protein
MRICPSGTTWAGSPPPAGISWRLGEAVSDPVTAMRMNAIEAPSGETDGKTSIIRGASARAVASSSGRRPARPSSVRSVVAPVRASIRHRSASAGKSSLSTSPDPSGSQAGESARGSPPGAASMHQRWAPLGSSWTHQVSGCRTSPMTPATSDPSGENSQPSSSGISIVSMTGSPAPSAPEAPRPDAATSTAASPTVPRVRPMDRKDTAVEAGFKRRPAMGSPGSRAAPATRRSRRS